MCMVIWGLFTPKSSHVGHVTTRELIRLFRIFLISLYNSVLNDNISRHIGKTLVSCTADFTIVNCYHRLSP